MLEFTLIHGPIGLTAARFIAGRRREARPIQRRHSAQSGWRGDALFEGRSIRKFAILAREKDRTEDFAQAVAEAASNRQFRIRQVQDR